MSQVALDKIPDYDCFDGYSQKCSHLQECNVTNAQGRRGVSLYLCLRNVCCYTYKSRTYPDLNNEIYGMHGLLELLSEVSHILFTRDWRSSILIPFRLLYSLGAI